jgi:hypothetical protein
MTHNPAALSSIFDQTDRSLITDVELERYYAGAQSPAASLRSQPHAAGKIVAA